MIDYEKLKEIRNMGYIKHTGIRTVELREGYAKCEIILDERHANPIGSTHGGVLFTLETNNNICLFCQHVGDFAFSFITPVCSYYSFYHNYRFLLRHYKRQV